MAALFVSPSISSLDDQNPNPNPNPSPLLHPKDEPQSQTPERLLTPPPPTSLSSSSSSPLQKADPNPNPLPPPNEEHEPQSQPSLDEDEANPNPSPQSHEPSVPDPAENHDLGADSPSTPSPPPLASSPPLPPSLIHLSFNQDHGCFAAGTDRGFRIYNCDPFREIFRRDFDTGGVGVVEMLFRCNILALVGGSDRLYYPSNKVMIWDDHQSRGIGELSFRSEVRAVRLRRDRIIVVLDHKIFVYNFADLKLVHQIETVPNPKGLCAVSQQQGSLVLVCPGGQKGQLRVEHYGAQRTKFIMAHDSRIACFALSQDARLVATASTKGTLVRIFSTVDGALLQEVRRGADRAEIYSLAFSANLQWLAVSSDKGTVHVFSLKVNLGLAGNDRPRPTPDPNVQSTTSSLSFIKGVLPKYFNSEWSVAQFRLHEGTQYIVAFGHQKNTVAILGMDGSFYRCEFDPATGGEMKQLECHNFLKQEEGTSS